MTRSAPLWTAILALLACAARPPRPHAPAAAATVAPPAAPPPTYRVRWDLADLGLPPPRPEDAPLPTPLSDGAVGLLFGRYRVIDAGERLTASRAPAPRPLVWAVRDHERFLFLDRARNLYTAPEFTATLTPVGALPAGYEPLSASPGRPLFLGNGQVRTVDAHGALVALEVPSGVRVEDAAFCSATHGALRAEDGRAFATGDGGATWRALTGTHDVVAIRCTAAGEVAVHRLDHERLAPDPLAALAEREQARRDGRFARRWRALADGQRGLVELGGGAPTRGGAMASFDGTALVLTGADGRALARRPATGGRATFHPWGDSLAAVVVDGRRAAAFRVRGDQIEPLPELSRHPLAHFAFFSDDGEHVVAGAEVCDVGARCRRLARWTFPLHAALRGEAVAWLERRALFVDAPAARREVALDPAADGCAVIGPPRVEGGAFVLIASRCAGAEGQPAGSRRLVVAADDAVRAEPLGRPVVDLVSLPDGDAMALTADGTLLHAADRALRWVELPDRLPRPIASPTRPILQRKGADVVVYDSFLVSTEGGPREVPPESMPPPSPADATAAEEPPSLAFPNPGPLLCRLTRSQNLGRAGRADLSAYDTAVTIDDREDQGGPALLAWRGASRGARAVEFTHPDFLSSEAPSAALADASGLWLFTEANAVAFAPRGNGAGFVVADPLWQGLRGEGFAAAAAIPGALAVVGAWSDLPHGTLAVGQWVSSNGSTGVPRALPLVADDSEPLPGAFGNAPAMFVLRARSAGASARMIALAPSSAQPRRFDWPEFGAAAACDGPLSGWFDVPVQIVDQARFVGPAPDWYDADRDASEAADFVARIGLRDARTCVVHWRGAAARWGDIRQQTFVPTAEGVTWTVTRAVEPNLVRHTFACTRPPSA